MTTLESDYYTFMHYDPQHSRAVRAHYVQFFDVGPVLELGCGRGEFLDLLAEAGVAASGVDDDDGMVAAARAAGHTVERGDALAALRARPPASLGGVFAAHLVEHLDAGTAADLVAAVARVLRPGGTFVAVVPNAACRSVLARDFWRDPTHVRFYDPDLLAFLCSRAGLTVEQTGANPLDHPGAPPPTRSEAVSTPPDLTAAVDELLVRVPPRGRLRRRGERAAWELATHLLHLLDERLRATQYELYRLRGAHEAMLEELYQPNEVYVVARSGAPGGDGDGAAA